MLVRISMTESHPLISHATTINLSLINEPPSRCNLLCARIIEIACNALCGEPEWWFYISSFTQVTLYTIGLPLTIATNENRSSAFTIGVLLLSVGGALTLFNILKACYKVLQASNKELTPLVHHKAAIQV